MYSVKQIDRNGDHRILPADTVSFDAAANELTLHRVAGDVKLTSGHVYVMNDAGKTVSVYNFERKFQQQQPAEGAHANGL